MEQDCMALSIEGERLLKAQDYQGACLASFTPPLLGALAPPVSPLSPTASSVESKLVPLSPPDPPVRAICKGAINYFEAGLRAGTDDQEVSYPRKC